MVEPSRATTRCGTPSTSLRALQANPGRSTSALNRGWSRKRANAEFEVDSVNVPPSAKVRYEVTGEVPGSAAFWLDEPRQLPNTLRSTGLWLSGESSYLGATFRIRSPVPGASASGRVVKGKVVVPVCPGDCYEVQVPFVLRIP